MRSSFSRPFEIYDSISIEKRYLIGLGFVGVLRFINLGFYDMQTWDEALYAVRSMGMLKYGEWIDQTAVSIDGLYSSFHPPLYIWLTAIAQSLFGFTEFAGRFFSAVAGAGTLFVVYAIGKELDQPKTGCVAASLFGLSPFVTFYSRQGQLDTTMTFFITLAMFFVIRMIGAKNPEPNAIRAGAALGLALLSRAFVGMGIALALFVWIVWARSYANRRYLVAILKLVGIGLIVVAPWYIYMTIIHGEGDPFFFLTSADLWNRMALGFEGNAKPLGPFYYVNQLIIIMPLGIAWGALALYRIARERESGWMFLAISFFVFFAVFSAVRSKLAVYLLPGLVPFALLAARELVSMTEKENSRRTMLLMIGATLLSVLWSLRHEWRDAVRELLNRMISFNVGVDLVSIPLVTFFVALLITTVALLIWFRKSDVHALRRYLLPAMLIPAFVVMALHVMLIDRFGHVDGAHALVSYVEEIKPEKIVVAGYERNPQLTYYFGGVDIGWRTDLQMRRIIPPKDSLQFRIWLTLEMQHETRDALLIVEKDKFIRYTMIDPLRIAPENYALAFESRRYAVFVYIPFINLTRGLEGNRPADPYVGSCEEAGIRKGS